MLNYETLLSSYDDKLTLMQWLKKVEDALKDASAVGFSVINKANATISFQIDFEDGTSLESGDIVLQQGESVASAYISSGHLHIVLTNGDDIDAGALFNGDVTLTGNFTATGEVLGNHLSSLNDLDVGQNAAIAGSLNVNAVANLDGGVSVTGDAAVDGNVGVDGNLSVTGTYSSDSGSVNVGGSVSAVGGISTPTASVTSSLSTPRITSTASEIEALKPIVETMTGYSFQPHSNLAANGVVLNYAGVVKNGNKLTMAIAGVFTCTTGVPTTSNFDIGSFTIPQSVADKLVLNSLSALDNRSIAFFDGTTSSVSKYGRVSKNVGQNVIRFSLYSMGSTFALDTPYEFRYEVTFLLSDSLA